MLPWFMTGNELQTIMQAMLTGEAVPLKPSASTTVTWREPVEVSSLSRASAGSDDGIASGAPAQGSRPVSGSRSGPGTPTTTPSSFGWGDSESRNGQVEGLGNSSGVPESVMIVPMDDVPTSTELGTRKVIRSRSRPRRPEEPAPFLSVDTLPVDKVVVEGKTPTFKTGRPTSGRHFTGSPKKYKEQASLNNSMNSSLGGRRTPQTPQGYGQKQGSRPNSRASSSSFNYNSFFTHKNAAFLSAAGPPSLWSMGNKYWPHNSSPTQKRRGAAFPPVMVVEATSAKPNQLVTQPFKQDSDAPLAMERPVSPSQDLKERTLHAVREVSRDLAKKTSPSTPTRGGRLLKGKLKPLHTFKLQGPSIEECKGVQAEERPTHTPSQARLLQRKRELLSMLPPDILQRPMTQESVHRTSIASNLSDDRIHDLESAMRTEDDVSALPNNIVQMSAFTRMPPNSLASFGSISDMAEPDGTTSPSSQDALITAVDIPAENGTDQPNGNLENSNANSAEITPNKHMSPNLSATKVDKEEQAAAQPEATMTDYLNEGGAASILSDMVDRVKHSAQRVSEEVAEAVEDVFHQSMLVNSEPPSSRSETPAYRSVVSDDGAFESASQRSVRFSDIEGSVGVSTHEDGSLSGVSVSSSRVAPAGTEDVTAVGYKITKDELVHRTPSEQSLLDTNAVAVTDVKNDIENANQQQEEVKAATEQEESLSTTQVDMQTDSQQDKENSMVTTKSPTGEPEAVKETLESSESAVNLVREPTESKKNQTVQSPPEINQSAVTPENTSAVTDEQVDQTDTSQCVEQAEITGDSTIKSEQSDLKAEAEVKEGSPATQEPQHVTDPSNKLSDDSNNNISIAKDDQIKDLMQSVKLTEEEQPLVEQKQTEGNMSSEQKPSSAISTDLQVASDAQNLDQVNPVPLSPSSQNVEMHQSSELASQAISDSNNKPDPSKNKEQNDDEGDDEEAEQGESCNKETDIDKQKKYDDDPGGSHGDSGGGSSSSAGGGGHVGNSDNGNNDQKMNGQGESGQGDGGNNSHGNECNDSENGKEPNETCYSTDFSEQVNDAEQRTSEQNSINSVRRHPYNHPSNNPSHHSEKRAAKCWYGDLEDDVPEIEDSVLFCGICGLDEDSCLCPHSSLAPNRTQSGISKPTYNDAISSVANENRLLSAPGVLQSDRTVPESDLSLGENRIVLEYKALLGQDESSGCYSAELSSSPRKQASQTEPAAHFLLRGVSVMSGEERQDDQTDDENNVADDSACGIEADESEPKSAEDLSEGADPSTLEVVAQPKTLSRPRSAKKKPAPQPAPFPPLCFRINVRPPAGKLFYFAYGVDMNPKRMATYLGSTVERRWGVLFGFKLKFNKRGSDVEAGGFPNIEFDPESSVEGCVYVMTQAQLNTLDMFMGSPQFYTHAMFPVWMSNCYQPEEFGVAQYCVPALTYIALDKWTHTDTAKPLSCRYSIDQCLKGSDLLTTDYIQHMKAQLVS